MGSRWGAWLALALLTLTACRPTAAMRAFDQRPFPTARPTPTAVVHVIFVNTSARATPPAAPAGATCATLIPVCWDEADKAKVAHICYDEARGLLTPGMASCASTVARRQLRPEWYGGPDLDDLLRWDQFRVDAALSRPWTRGISPPAEALAAVDAFLADERGEGCWGYDSFRGRTPEEARAFVAEAPERRCAVILAPQAMLFFNWRNP